MKPNFIGSVLLTVLALASIVLCGCSKEKETEKEPVQQPSIYGMVRDYDTSEPIDNVNLVLNPSNRSTFTANGGHFEFFDLEAGRYTIIAQKEGYYTDRKSFIVKTGESIEVSFSIKKIRAAK